MPLVSWVSTTPTSISGIGQCMPISSTQLSRMATGQNMTIDLACPDMIFAEYQSMIIFDLPVPISQNRAGFGMPQIVFRPRCWIFRGLVLNGYQAGNASALRCARCSKDFWHNSRASSVSTAFLIFSRSRR